MVAVFMEITYHLIYLSGRGGGGGGSSEAQMTKLTAASQKPLSKLNPFYGGK